MKEGGFKSHARNHLDRRRCRRAYSGGRTVVLSANWLRSNIACRQVMAMDSPSPEETGL